MSIESNFVTFMDVIHSLTANAMQHAFEDQADKKFEITLRSVAENGIEVVVADNGHGIPKELLPSIFEPFSTLKKAQGHHGLGLYAVHNLVTSLLKGKIEVKSTYPDGGTRFILTLPDQKAVAELDAEPQDSSRVGDTA